MRPAQGPVNTADAVAMLDAAFGHLTATDWAAMGSRAQGEVLAGLTGVQAKLTALHARVLSAFAAGRGHEPDGHGTAKQWLIHRAGISKGAACGAAGWRRRLERHGVIAAAMASGTVSESWGKEIAGWTDPLPAQERDDADRILLDAAMAGCPLDDLELLARTIYETWKARHPDPDDGNGAGGDEDGFEDRRLLLGTTLGGAGTVRGDLTASCAAKLQAIFDALGKQAGPDDWRTAEQRQHDALDDALGRLIKAGLLPEAAGQTTLAQVIIPLSALRQLPGASAAEQAWIAAQAGQPGWLSGTAAEAAACDAKIVPVVTGTVDWQAADAMTSLWMDAHGLPAITPEAKARLRHVLLAMAADAMSGPGGLASYLRGKLLGEPFTGKSLPLDVGRASNIPDHLRRAVILRDRHCGWPGGCDRPPGASHIHHIVERSQGGHTRLNDLILMCDYHHLVKIHREGWKLTRHADGTTEAISPHGEILRSHGPPTTKAG